MKEVRMAEGPVAEAAVESTEAVNVYRSFAECVCNGVFAPDGTSVPEMTPLGPSGRTLFRHRCNSCGRGTWFTHRYPRLHYVPAEISIEEQMKQLMKERVDGK